MGESPPSALIQLVARLLLPVSLVLAAALVVRGLTGTGDGFAAGVVAALGILAQPLAFGRRRALQLTSVRRLAAFAIGGLATALAIAFVPVLRGEALFTHSPPAGESPIRLGTLELTTSLAFDVAIGLLVVGVVVGALAILDGSPAEEPGAKG